MTHASKTACATHLIRLLLLLQPGSVASLVTLSPGALRCSITSSRRRRIDIILTLFICPAMEGGDLLQG
jgi:hypothetical protein